MPPGAIDHVNALRSQRPRAMTTNPPSNKSATGQARKRTSKSTKPQPTRSANNAGVSKRRIIKKRHRKIAACKNCRERKVRCDKDHPCSQCNAKGLDCVYIENAEDLRKVAARVVKKRHREVKVCLHCRTRKMACDQKKPCRSCQDADLDCDYQQSGPRDRSSQQAADPVPASPTAEGSSRRHNVEREADKAVPKPSAVFNDGHQEATASQGGPSGFESYSNVQHYGPATPLGHPQPRHQYSNHPFDMSAQLRCDHPQHQGFVSPNGQLQTNGFGHNNHREGYNADTTGGGGYRGPPYMPMLDASDYAQQRVLQNYNPLPHSPYGPTYHGPHLAQPQTLQPPRQIFRGLTSQNPYQYQGFSSSSSARREAQQETKVDVKPLERETADITSQSHTRQQSNQYRGPLPVPSPLQPRNVQGHTWQQSNQSQGPLPGPPPFLLRDMQGHPRQGVGLVRQIT